MVTASQRGGRQARVTPTCIGHGLPLMALGGGSLRCRNMSGIGGVDRTLYGDGQMALLTDAVEKVTAEKL